MRRKLRRFVVVCGLAVCALGGFSVASAAAGAAPPGATARCNDGTYSYSQTRSGTCSHHGGVALWLTSARPVALGATVLLAPRTKTSGCTLAAEPDRRCSPGAYYRGLTKTVLCSSSFHTSSIRNVPDSEKHAVEQEYGLAPTSYGSTLEIDHIVSLELGGSNDPANLFPERAGTRSGYHAKDKLENAVHTWVCQGKISLHNAQEKIATDWEALYKLVFGTALVG
jgi:hypothetical protein